MANASTSVTISFSGASEPRDVVLTVKDWCSDQAVPGASVTLGTYGTKTADANGQVNFAAVAPGTHSLTITAAGYVASGSDTLANDSITV